MIVTGYNLLNNIKIHEPKLTLNNNKWREKEKLFAVECQLIHIEGVLELENHK